MTGIIPDAGNGGVIVRDGGGNCLNPAGVTNDYCPSADFTSTCQIRYLPDGCEARITPAQINAFQSELMCFAETLNPEGTWNCGSLCNLSINFTSWAASAGNYQGSMLDYMQTHLCNRPAVTDLNALPAPSFIICNGNGGIRRIVPGDVAQYIVDSICDNDPAGILAQLIGCIISQDAGNIIEIGGDGGLYADRETAVQIANKLCNSAAATTIIQDCLEPYPSVVAGNNTTVVTDVGPNGEVRYRVNAAAAAGAVGSFSALNPPGNVIGIYDDGLGTNYTLSESLTGLTRNPDGSLTYLDETGTANLIPCTAGLDFTCEGGGITVEDCDGVEVVKFKPTQRRTESSLPANSFSVDENTLVGPPIPGSTQFINFDFGNGCPQAASLLLNIGWFNRFGSPNNGVGGFTSRAEVSYNGGATWNNAPIGGGQQIMSALGLAVSQEMEFVRYDLGPPLTGVQTIGLRMILFANNFTGTTFDSTKSSLVVDTVEMACC